jgi:hypothetical protein
MVDRESNGILRRLVTQWGHMQAELTRLQSTAEVRPENGYDVFQFWETGSTTVATFELLPVVFNLPERGDDHNNDLFVVVKGRLSFDRKEYSERDILATHDFGTQVAYFRRTSAGLNHVYGAHYDFALDEIGHPVFHGQMKSYLDLADHVKTQYSVQGDVTDLVNGLLRNVRVPTAQMDVFSLFIELSADHLLYEKSGPEEKDAFNSLLNRSVFCQGAAFQLPRLGTEEARTCYRARHWYPAIV